MTDAITLIICAAFSSFAGYRMGMYTAMIAWKRYNPEIIPVKIKGIRKIQVAYRKDYENGHTPSEN